MSISLSAALLIGLIYFAANTAFLGGLSYFTTWRPLVNGLLVGLVLGDPFRGAIIGASINLLYLGYVSVGGTLGHGDGALAGVIGSAVGIALKSQGIGILAGVLVASLGYQLLTWRMQGDDVIARWIDAAAARGDVRRMQLLHIGAAQAWLFALTVLPAALIVLTLVPVIAIAQSALPGPIVDGIALGGRLSVALGAALALRFVFSSWNIVLFFAGAVWSAFRLPFEALVGFGIVGVMTAVLATRRTTHELPNTTPLTRLPFWLWQFFSHSNYSMTRLQGSGLGCALAASLPTAARMRHGGFFNTEVNFGALIPAVLLRMEKRGASPAEIDKTRATLMGTIAGFGDAATQGALLPALMAAAIGLVFSATTGVWAVPLFVLATSVVMLAISLTCYAKGAQLERNAAAWLLDNARLKITLTVARAFLAAAIGGIIGNLRAINLPMPVYGLTNLVLANAAGAVLLTLVLYVLTVRLAIKPLYVLGGLVTVSVVFQLAQAGL